jgi:ABC-type transport system involved in multi-copper enzyme maturation permease subunit
MRIHVPALAFFTRYLREDARSWLTALVRGGVLVLCLLSLWMFTDRDINRPESAPGRSLLLVFSMVALTAVHLFGVSHFASVITEEKEEQTLGLLVITGLHPVAILAGKAGARLLGGGLVLLLSLPLSLLCYALGGVSGPQVVGTYVVLGVMLICLSAAGLLMSILSGRTRLAVSLVVLLLVVLHLGGPIINFVRWLCVENDWFAQDSLHMAALNGLANAWMEANPYRRLSLVLSTFHDEGWIPSGLLPMCVPALVFYVLSIPAFVRLTGNLREGEGGGRKRRAATANARARAPLEWTILWKDHRWRAARPWMAWLYPLGAIGACQG